jgi:hypothetical protein
VASRFRPNFDTNTRTRAREAWSLLSMSFNCAREGGIEKTINRKIKGRVQFGCGQAGKPVKLS